MAKEKFKIGQKVFVINKDVEIEEKEVLAVINEKKKIGYTLDENSCGGYDEKDVFETENKAKVAKQNFLDELRFKVGDLIIFKIREYNREEIVIGKVKKISFGSSPYHITTYNHSIHNLYESKIILKVKNEFIENFGRMEDLRKEFKEQRKVMSFILEKISREYDEIEAELKQSFKKQLQSWWGGEKQPIFHDRFTYEERGDYYD